MKGVRGPTAAELLETPSALLTRTHLRDLGLERRAVDAVFRAIPIVVLPGYSRPLSTPATTSNSSRRARTPGIACAAARSVLVVELPCRALGAEEPDLVVDRDVRAPPDGVGRTFREALDADEAVIG